MIVFSANKLCVLLCVVLLCVVCCVSGVGVVNLDTLVPPLLRTPLRRTTPRRTAQNVTLFSPPPFRSFCLFGCLLVDFVFFFFEAPEPSNLRVWSSRTTMTHTDPNRLAKIGLAKVGPPVERGGSNTPSKGPPGDPLPPRRPLPGDPPGDPPRRPSRRPSVGPPSVRTAFPRTPSPGPPSAGLPKISLSFFPLPPQFSFFLPSVGSSV